MIPIGLNLRNKHVLIVGGGKVALRKTKLFLFQGALITLVSPTFLDEFFDLNVKCILDNYSSCYLKDMFLVYACTNDKDINDLIVEQCNASNILCGSATRNEFVSFNSLAFEDTDVGMIALSTHQKMPYTKPIMQELKEILVSKKEQLEKLSYIRQYLVDTHQINTELINQMYSFSNQILDFICDVIKNKQGYVFVYHQSNYTQHYSFSLMPYIVVSLKKFEKLHEVFELLNNIKIIPLLLSDGFIYQKLKNMTSLNILSPLISKKEDVQTMISSLRKDNVTNVWLMHPRSQNELMSQFKANVFKGDIVQTFDEPLVFEENKDYHVVVLLMTEGEHYHQLIKQLPPCVTVSKILPLEQCIVDMMMSKI